MFPSLHLRRNTIRADQRTCLSPSNFMTSRRTHHESTLTLQLTGSLQFTCLQLTVQPSLSRAHQTPSSASQTGCTLSICKLNHLLSRRSTVHRDHNTSPLREIQLFTSTWSTNQLLENKKQLHTSCITKCGWAFTAAYATCPRDQANHSSLK